MTGRTAMLALALAFALALDPVLAADAQTAAPVAGPTVRVIRVETSELVASTTVTGTLVARDEVQVGPEIDGSRIVELLAEEGQTVQKGDVLARLSRDLLDAQLASLDAALARARVAVSQAQSQVDEAQANLDQSGADLERAQALIRSGNTTAATLDQRVAASKTAKARLEAAGEGVKLAQAEVDEATTKRAELALRLTKTEIRAPASGRISERAAKLGALAPMAGEPLFRIIRDGQIELEADIAEVTLAQLAEGQPAQIVPVGRKTPIEGRVRLVAPSIDPQTRLGRVKIALDDSSGLTVGTFARGRVETARATGVVVPISAVQFQGAKATVQVVKDELVETRPVTIGLRTSDDVLVEAGLKPDERIVALSGTFLRGGDRVHAVEAP